MDPYPMRQKMTRSNTLWPQPSADILAGQVLRQQLHALMRALTCSVWHSEQEVWRPRVFWRHWWHVMPFTLS